MPVSYPYDLWNVNDRLPSSRTYVVDVLTTPTLIAPISLRRLRLRLVNTGANTIYLSGDSAVTVSTGYQLQKSEKFDTDVPYELWAIADSGPSTMAVLIEEVAQAH